MNITFIKASIPAKLAAIQNEIKAHSDKPLSDKPSISELATAVFESTMPPANKKFHLVYLRILGDSRFKSLFQNIYTDADKEFGLGIPMSAKPTTKEIVGIIKSALEKINASNMPLEKKKETHGLLKSLYTITAKTDSLICQLYSKLAPTSFSDLPADLFRYLLGFVVDDNYDNGLPKLRKVNRQFAGAINYPMLLKYSPHNWRPEVDGMRRVTEYKTPESVKEMCAYYAGRTRSSFIDHTHKRRVYLTCDLEKVRREAEETGEPQRKDFEIEVGFDRGYYQVELRSDYARVEAWDLKYFIWEKALHKYDRNALVNAFDVNNFFQRASLEGQELFFSRVSDKDLLIHFFNQLSGRFPTVVLSAKDAHFPINSVEALTALSQSSCKIDHLYLGNSYENEHRDFFTEGLVISPELVANFFERKEIKYLVIHSTQCISSILGVLPNNKFFSSLTINCVNGLNLRPDFKLNCVKHLKLINTGWNHIEAEQIASWFPEIQGISIEHEKDYDHDYSYEPFVKTLLTRNPHLTYLNFNTCYRLVGTYLSEHLESFCVGLMHLLQNIKDRSITVSYQVDNGYLSAREHAKTAKRNPLGIPDELMNFIEQEDTVLLGMMNEQDGKSKKTNMPQDTELKDYMENIRSPDADHEMTEAPSELTEMEEDEEEVGCLVYELKSYVVCESHRALYKALEEASRKTGVQFKWDLNKKDKTYIVITNQAKG